MQFAIQQPSTQVFNPTTESKRAAKHLIRYLKGTQHTCLRLEPHGMVQKGLLELVGRSDSDWAADSATRQSVTGYRCNVQGVTMCNRSVKHTAISLNSCEADVYAASACARELLGLAELFKELHYDVAVRLEMGFRLGKTHSTAQGTGGGTSTSRYDAWQYNNGYEQKVFTKHLGGLRTQLLAKKLGLRLQDKTARTERMDNGREAMMTLTVDRMYTTTLTSVH